MKPAQHRDIGDGHFFLFFVVLESLVVEGYWWKPRTAWPTGLEDGVLVLEKRLGRKLDRFVQAYARRKIRRVK